MSDTFKCDDKELLVAYLYDEINGDERRQIDAHLRTCAACARELEGLQAVRHDLSAWQPPEPQLDFTIVSNSARVLRPPRWSIQSVPAWARVAAAVLVLAASAGVANLHIRYGGEGLTITTGWMSAPQPVATASAPAVRTEDWRPALAALQTDLRRELQNVQTSAVGTRPGAPVAPASFDSAGMMRTVRTLIDESEQRQRRELALRMTQFSRDVDLQRRADLVRIDQTFGQLNGRTGAVVESQAQMMNLLRRVSTQVP